MNTKTALISILSMIISVSAMADPQQIGMGNSVAIAADAETADCDHDVLATYTGPTNLEADWTANQITLHWYNDNTEIDTTGTTSATCTYDGSITLPATDPIKTGYTFKGWQVRVAVPKQCWEITDVDECVNTQGCAYYDRCRVRVESCDGLNETDCEHSKPSEAYICVWYGGFCRATFAGGIN